MLGTHFFSFLPGSGGGGGGGGGQFDFSNPSNSALMILLFEDF